MTAYEVRISDWSSDVCSSDLAQDEDLQVAESLILSLPKHEGRDAASWRRTLVPEVYVLQGLLDLQVLDQRDGKSSARRVGKERVSTCTSRGSPYASNTKRNKQKPVRTSDRTVNNV